MGVWGSTWCLRMDCVWVVVPVLDSLFVWLVVVGVVCENCIVDASIFLL